MNTVYAVFSVISLCLLVGAAIFSVYLGRCRYRSGTFLTSSKTMFLGVFLSSVSLFLPIYWYFFDETTNLLSRVGKTILISIHHSIRLFAIDSDFEIIKSALADVSPSWATTVFSSLAAMLFILAPILTFSFILSFFKNFAAYRKVLMHPRADVYVFSELSEKSLALAESIYKSSAEKPLLIFTDVYEKDEEESFELLEKSKEIEAICFKADMLSVNLKLRSAQSRINFFAIGENESENISQALQISKNPSYRYRDRTRLYIFSVSTEGELLISNIQADLVKEIKKDPAMPHIRVKRVNDMRSLVYRTLYTEGLDLFHTALPISEGEKLISVLILGTGGQGGEMIRALSWFCQMVTADTKYRVSIHAFDKDPLAKEKFEALCPELMHESYNGVYVDGESQYRIEIHGGVDVDTSTFMDEVRKIGPISYTFVSLGTDELNVKAAVSLRVLFERMRLPQKPIIQAVVYDSDNKRALEGAKNAFGDSYDIAFVGDRDTLYSADVVVDSELEDAALAIHKRYGGDANMFWAHEYSYHSSLASAIHNATRIKLGVPGAGKHEDELTEEEERRFIEVLEHRRWNAYMRSEGFVYSGSKDKASRNNLGKMHHNLVCFDDLSEEDKRKDSIVATKKSK